MVNLPRYLSNLANATMNSITTTMAVLDLNQTEKRDAERLQRRRERVRQNVRSFRQRKKALAEARLALRTLGEDDESRPPHRGPYPDLELISKWQCINLRSEVRDGMSSWSLQMPFKISAGPTNQRAFVTAFNDRCQLPDTKAGRTKEEMHISICCGWWIESICMEASEFENSTISHAILASALATTGRIRQDPAMMTAAMDVQSTALSSLRRALGTHTRHPDKKDLPRLCGTVLTCAVTEFLANKSWDRFALHLRGVGSLIEMAGPEAFGSSATLNQLHGYRSVQVAFSFIERKASFLSHPEWTDVHLALDGLTDSQHLMFELLDIMFQIPSVMQSFDEYSATEDTESLVTILARVGKIKDDLEDWEERANLGFAWLTPLISLQEFDRSFQSQMMFDDVRVAAFCTYFCAANVAAAQIELELQWQLQINNQFATLSPLYRSTSTNLEWTMRAMQCLNYHLDTSSDTMGKLFCLFCLDVTWQNLRMLDDMQILECTEQIGWCEMLATELGRGFPALRMHR